MLGIGSANVGAGLETVSLHMKGPLFFESHVSIDVSPWLWALSKPVLLPFYTTLPEADCRSDSCSISRP